MGDEVRLRDVEQSDLEIFFEQEQDPEAVRRAQFPARERDVFMRHWAIRILGDPTAHQQTVVVGDEVAGSIVAWWEKDERFVGYWLGRAFWGRGVGTAALRLFLARERVRPLFADPYAGNAGSVRLLEKLGFRREGTVRYGENEHVMLVLRPD